MIMDVIGQTKGGEVFVPKMKKAKIINILRLITGRQEFEIIGLFPGEKLHEELVGHHEIPYCFDEGGYYVIRPGKPNENPVEVFSTENAEEFSEAELKELMGLKS